jgi:Ca-activated chloride channel family protein
MRISLAKEAIRTFLGSITNPRDTVGLAAFNTLYTSLADPAGGNARIGSSLDAIQRPAREMAYTELYAGLVQTAEDLSGYGGRRVVIVLSDGENYPYSVYERQAHPRYGQKVFVHTEPIERAQREGVSIFAINFGRQKDPNLQAIAVETGGAVFDAADREELSAVYQRIRERVRQEYLIGYRATMDPAERKFVRVEYLENGEVRATDRFYYASTVFGLPARRLGWLLVLPFLLAVALWYLLTRLKLEREAARPSLEVLRAQRGAVSTRMFDLGSGQTVIGATAEADLTISGVPTVRQKHATIVYDPGQKGYTLVGEGDLTVNNRPVTRRKLEEGDVINVEGTTIVFHQPPEKGEAGESRRPEARRPAARPRGHGGRRGRAGEGGPLRGRERKREPGKEPRKESRPRPKKRS